MPIGYGFLKCAEFDQDVFFSNRANPELQGMTVEPQAGQSAEFTPVPSSRGGGWQAQDVKFLATMAKPPVSAGVGVGLDAWLASKAAGGGGGGPGAC